MFVITTYQDKYLTDSIELILGIQQKEFNIPVTLETQPDLLKIPETYQTGKGNFWLALHEDRPVGTIGLMDIGGNMGAIRKMFVRANHRGRQAGVSHQLLHTLMAWSYQKGITQLFLGTVDKLHAAHRFYEKNGFSRIAKQQLPEQFPLMKVDTLFFKYEFNKNSGRE